MGVLHPRALYFPGHVDGRMSSVAPDPGVRIRAHCVSTRKCVVTRDGGSVVSCMPTSLLYLLCLAIVCVRVRVCMCVLVVPVLECGCVRECSV